MSNRIANRFKLNTENRKESNFDVSLPWDVSIANYLGIPVDELHSNLGSDNSLNDTISSTCALIRDYSIRKIFLSNPLIVPTLKDICYGDGYSILNGSYIQTGGCKRGRLSYFQAPTIPKKQDHNEFTDFKGQCIKKPGQIYVNFPDPSKTGKEQLLKGYKDKNKDKDKKQNVSDSEVETLNVDQSQESTVQTPSNEANENEKTVNLSKDQNISFNFKEKKLHLNNKYDPEILDLSKMQPDTEHSKIKVNNKVSGSHPMKRYEYVTKTSQKHANRYNQKRPGQKNENLLVSVFGDDIKPIAQDPGLEIKDSTPGKRYNVLDIPDFMCNVICAGLHLDNVVSGDENIEEPSSDSEEREKKKNKKKPSSKVNYKMNGGNFKHKGLYECENILPDYKECVNQGQQISQWFLERFLNPTHVCNWEKGNCGTLFK